MPSIWSKLAKRLSLFIFMLFLLSVIVFYVARLTPGDPLQSFFGDAMETMSTAQLDAARERLGLTGPIYIQYYHWIAKVLRGDFGLSLRYKKPVSEVVGPLLGNTLILGVTAYALVFILAISLALVCVRYEDRLIDKVICRAGTTAFYIPAFWLGVVLVLLFSVNLRWLPSSGAYSLGKSH
ncbi:MAG: ABC transporter permease, partial [Deltaproteobacteria bacterium]|nr:ABC transporter permease [Deltaproteobacteria bacterium]